MEGAESLNKASWTKKMLHTFCDICIVAINRGIWTKKMLHTFCDICIVAINRGMRLNTHFNKAR
jgi:hypothetical protein